MSKIHTLALIFVCFLAGLSGDYFSSVVFAKQESSNSIKDRITARSLVIVDRQNKPRAGLGFDPDGYPVVFLKDKNDKARLVLGSSSNGPIIFLTDSQGANSLFISTSNNGESTISIGKQGASNNRLTLVYDPDHGPGIGLYDENNTAKAVISVIDGNPSVTLLDRDKKPAIAMFNKKGRGSYLSIWNSNNDPSVSLAVQGDKPGLFMYQQPRTGLLFNMAGGRPALALMDHGSPIWSATGDVPPAPELPPMDDMMRELTR